MRVVRTKGNGTAGAVVTENSEGKRIDMSVNDLLSGKREGNLEQAEKESNKHRKISSAIYVIDIIVSIIIINYSKNMFFWILDFHIIIFQIYQIVRLVHFIKNVRDQHK